MGPSTRGSLCLVDNELNEHHPPQGEVLFAYFNFSLSPTPPSTRTSRSIVEKFVTLLKHKFSLPNSIFHSLLPHPQREVLVVSLTNKRKICVPPQREVLFAYLNFSLSPPPPSTRGARCLVDNELNEHCPPQREVLFAYLNYSLSPPPPSTRGSLCLVDNKLNEHYPPQREV